MAAPLRVLCCVVAAASGLVAAPPRDKTALLGKRSEPGESFQRIEHPGARKALYGAQTHLVGVSTVVDLDESDSDIEVVTLVDFEMSNELREGPRGSRSPKWRTPTRGALPIRARTRSVSSIPSSTSEVVDSDPAYQVDDADMASDFDDSDSDIEEVSLVGFKMSSQLRAGEEREQVVQTEDADGGSNSEEHALPRKECEMRAKSAAVNESKQSGSEPNVDLNDCIICSKQPGPICATCAGELDHLIEHVDPEAVVDNAQYKFFEPDIEHYRSNFTGYLPSLERCVAQDLVLFLPVSYHLNPSNFRDIALLRYKEEVAASPEWKDMSVCSANGATTASTFCGFAGRAPRTQLGGGGNWSNCFADARDAFGPREASRNVAAASDSAVQVSFYFTWYSKRENQPLLSGFWTNPLLSNSSLRSGCAAGRGICDPACRDSGGRGPTQIGPADQFVGCNAERTCTSFATCGLGGAVISGKKGEHWRNMRPKGFDNRQRECESAGYAFQSSTGFCKYQGTHLDCNTGRCFDRGHLVPSGVGGWHYGRSGETFSMCNVGGQTALLNQCKLQWLDQVIACMGQYHRALVYAGALGPFTESKRMKFVSRPAAFFKVVFVPRLNQTFVWIFKNDEHRTYRKEEYTGFSGLLDIEWRSGFRFPGAVRHATFPNDCSMLHEVLSQGTRLGSCDIVSNSDASSARYGPYFVLQTCAGHAASEPMCPNFQSKAKT